MNRLVLVSMVGVLLLSGAAHSSDTVLDKAVENCIAETMSHQRDALSDNEIRVVESRVKQECRNIVYRECRDSDRPLCQHFSGMKMADVEHDYSRSNVVAAFRN